MLESFPDRYRAVVFGASGGLGSAFVTSLLADERCAVVYGGSRGNSAPASERFLPFLFDLDDEASIAAAIEGCTAAGPLHLVIVATGLLHDPSMQPEKTWGALDRQSFERSFAINTIGPALIGKHVLKYLAREGKSVFAALSARVGSIADNRSGGWHAYRASKAALNMMLRTWAIELRMRNKVAICVGLHPGTVRTALSEPFLRGPTSRSVFSPVESVTHLMQVIDDAHPTSSGRVYAWDGSEIPF